MAIIEVYAVQKRYGKTIALEDVSLTIEPARLSCLIGPDGAGKSSLIHIIAGVLDPDNGKVVVDGINVLDDPGKLRMRIGLMAQGLGHTLSPELSIEENINYFADIRNVKRNEREPLKKKLLEATQLERFTNRPAKNLSGGMKQKLALCCTLIHRPSILLLDEPTTGVDPVSRRDFYRVLRDFIERDGVTVLVSTSYMDEAERSDSLALMHEGRVLTTGETSELKRGSGEMILELETDRQDEFISFAHEQLNTEAMQRGKRVMITARSSKAFDTMRIRLVQAGFPEPTRREMDTEYLFVNSIRSNVEIQKESIAHLVSQLGMADASMNAEKPAINAQGLTRRFGSFTAVDSVDFEVQRGEVFGFLGPNGAGKTTLIKMLCGLLPPSNGNGTVLGNDIGDKHAIARRIGYMSQKFSLYGDLRIRENIELFGGIYGLSGSELRRRADAALALAELTGRSNVPTKSLPLGIKQRLALCCAVLHQPQLLFLDEPTSGVDPLVRDRFWRIIFQLSRAHGITIIVTTHYMDEAERCDRLMMMLDGGIRALGSPNELREQAASEVGRPIVVNSPEAGEVEQLLVKRFDRVSRFGSEVFAYCPNPKKQISEVQSILGSVSTNTVRVGQIPFEDLFIHFAEKRHESVV